MLLLVGMLEAGGGPLVVLLFGEVGELVEHLGLLHEGVLVLLLALRFVDVARLEGLCVQIVVHWIDFDFAKQKYYYSSIARISEGIPVRTIAPRDNNLLKSEN